MENRRGAQLALRPSAAEPAAPISSEMRDGFRNHESPLPPSTAEPTIMSHRTSHESDRTSTVSGLTAHFPSNPIHVTPAPAYVSDAGASQAVSELRPSKNAASSDSDDEDGAADGSELHFSEPALLLINAFLDQLLYSFLSAARSTSLPALRPAVSDVLKHRLAREATSSADAELSELLAGADEEDEMDSKHMAQEARRKWDLELVWKRTRLRVMVYTRLGEMEDEDEQRHVERDDLFHGTERTFSSTGGLVAWSAAIYLTSVLEYVAEQALQVASQAAYGRARRENRSHPSTPSTETAAGDVIVEEHDVEKIALNPALGRLWRTWRKALRNQGVTVRPSSSSISRASGENMASPQSQRRGSADTSRDPNESRPMSRDQQDDIPEAEYPEHVLAANIPLPMAHPERDMDEIAAVGLARDPDDDDDAAADDDDDNHESGLFNEPYPEHFLAPLVPLPLYSEEKDLDDLTVPGLARDPDAPEDSQHPVREPYPGIMLALLVALPMINHQRDVDEIEVPGLAKDPDAEDEDANHAEQARRRNSFSNYVLSNPFDGSSAPNAQSLAYERTILTTKPRSSSGPTPARTPMVVEQTRAVDVPANVSEAPEPTKSTAQPHIAMLSKQSLGPLTTGYATTRDIQATSPQGVSRHARPSDLKISYMAAGTAVAAGTVAAGAAAWSAGASKGESVTGLRGISNEGHDTGLHAPGFMRTVSEESYNLVDASQHRLPQNDPTTSEIGIAHTLESPSQNQPKKRPEGLHLVSSSQTREESPSTDVPTPRTPRTFLDLAEDKGSAESEAEQPRVSVLDRSLLPALTDISEQHEVSPIEESPRFPPSPSVKSPHRSPGKDHLESVGVQEHPVVQRMASLKNSEGRYSSGSETALPLTSAAIRGPEDFDMFVQNGETLRYTLTPEGVRDTPGNNASRSSKDAPSATLIGLRSSTEGQMGTPTASRDTEVPAPNGAAATTPERYRSVSRPSRQNVAATFKTGLSAREPRVVTESTRDFADFIRSTGPNAAIAASPALLPTAASSPAQTTAITPGTSAAPAASKGVDANAPTIASIANRVKKNVQPREAKANNDGNLDLIEFLRSGPKETEHLTPGGAAPFRTTAESDQFNDGTDTQGAPSLMTASSLYASSLRTSTNSRSALLSGTNKNSPTAQDTSSRGVAAEPNVSRKQYRNKDPYAIDFDSDDEDDLRPPAVPRKDSSYQKDESMFDFLRSHEPAPSGPPQPLIDPNSPQAKRLINEARARQRGQATNAKTPPVAANISAPRSPTPQYGGTYKPSRQRMEARSAVTQGDGAGMPSGTHDLADFLRNSGPLEDSKSAPSPGIGKQSKQKIPAQEAKRKKSGVFGFPKRKTYLDMP